MGYQVGKSIGTILKTHYERLLYPFDVFKQGKTIDIVSIQFPIWNLLIYTVDFRNLNSHRKIPRKPIRTTNPMVL